MLLTESELYRHLHRGNPGDADFYRRAVADVSSVLELGCGWGRLTSQLIAPGRRVVGLESDATFAAWARELVPDADVRTADIRTFAVSETFDRILIPYNAIYCLGGKAGLIDCLGRCRSHLAEGGEVWFDCYPVDEFHAAALDGDVPPDDDEPVLTFEFGGETLTVVEQTALLPEEQRLQVTYEVLDTLSRLVLRSRLAHDYLLVADLFDAAATSGLVPLLVAGSFDGAPLDEDATQIVFGLSAAP